MKEWDAECLWKYISYIPILTFNFFPANLRAVSDEHGERFHQQISIMENSYQGNFNPNLVGGYCWFLQTETSSSFKRKKKRKQQSFI